MSITSNDFTWLHAILYGAVQGVTEYLPVSSSAHLILLPRFLKTEDPGLFFDVFLHVGTLFATLIYFRNEWISFLHATLRMLRREPEILGAPASPQGGSTPASIPPIFSFLAGIIPVLIFGALLHNAVETVFRGPYVIGVTLPLGGLLLWLTDRYSKTGLVAGLPTSSGVNAQTSLAATSVISGLQKLSFKQGLFIGLTQSLSLVPGMSRSGSTLIGSRLVGLNRVDAARLSFLLSAPVTFAAIAYETLKVIKSPELITPDWPVWGLACFSSFIFGILAIHGLIQAVSKMGFFSFFVYRALLGCLIFYVL